MKRSFILGVLAAVMVGVPAARAQTEQEFAAPPESAKPMTWWHWMQGNVSREGITADLEAMKRVGIGGALIFHVGQLPIEGDVKFLSQQWWDLMRFAGQEADRLGLKLGVHNCPGWSASGGPWIKVEQSMQKVVWSETKAAGPMQLSTVLSQPKSNWNYYRDIAVLAVPEGQSASPDQIIDLTASMDAQGKLTWDVPAGDWTILRIGHTTTGQGCAPAPPGGWGLECDKMDSEAVKAHFQAYPAKLLSTVGKPLSMIEIDSYEAGDQNWTPKFREEFARRRGYAITKWLPVLAGKTVGSEEQTRRFKQDMQRTISELFTENYHGAFADLVHQTPGVQFLLEPYGGPFDTITSGGKADAVMGEFWVNGWYAVESVASAAHVHEQKLVAAEAFTATPDQGRWQQDPAALRGPGDKAFALGVNQLVLHTTAHQPWVDASANQRDSAGATPTLALPQGGGDEERPKPVLRAGGGKVNGPGMTMGWWGTHFGRTQTWWEQSGPWFSYLARCQYLLQQGRPVADVLMLNQDFELDGYKVDRCDAEIVQQLRVENGRFVLPHGMSYRVLVLPNSPEMSPELARKVRDLVREGGTVFGPRPTRSPGLTNYPAVDTEIQAIGQEVWGDGAGKHRFGKGQAISAGSLREILSDLGCERDVFLRDAAYGRTILWTHRQSDSADIYFLSNQRNAAADVWASFRTAGRQPELWHAETGQAEPAPIWQLKDGRTDVLVQLPPASSTFVVFRHPAPTADTVVDLQRGGSTLLSRRAVPQGLEIGKAVYGVLADSAKQADVTSALQRRIREGGSLTADNTLAGDPAPMVVKQLRITYALAGQEHTITVPENGFIEFGAADTTRPDTMLSVSNSQTQLLAAKPGAYTLTYASGRRADLAVRDLPQEITAGGPWRLTFPPSLGAPAGVTLDKLISWAEHPDRGVRYFSGTATYRTQFTMSGEQFRKDLTWELDLGEVKNIAEVRLNGTSLGILWNAPFAVDATSALKPGTNDLEIRITNLWPNRMIGDEQEPDDCQWGDMQYSDMTGKSVAVGRPLARIPDWLKQGTVRPSAGRVTLTTWKFYEKDAPLLPSGLLGPVRLVPWKHVPVVTGH